MKFKKLLPIALLSAVSTFASAETFKFSGEYFGAVSNPMYPQLNLNDISDVKVTASSSDGQLELSLDRVELVFPNAKNLVATGFKPLNGDKNRLIAYVNNVWVYRKLAVEVEMIKGISAESPFIIRTYVVDAESLVSSDPLYLAQSIHEVNGTLSDVTPNPVADIVKTSFNDKPLTLKLHRRYTINEETGRSGFEVTANWLGHGVKTLVVDVPSLSHVDFDVKAISLEIEEFELSSTITDKILSVGYTRSDPNYVESSSPISLEMLLRDTYNF